MNLHVQVFGKNITLIITEGEYTDNYAIWLIDDSGMDRARRMNL